LLLRQHAATIARTTTTRQARAVAPPALQVVLALLARAAQRVARAQRAQPVGLAQLVRRAQPVRLAQLVPLVRRVPLAQPVRLALQVPLAQPVRLARATRAETRRCNGARRAGVHAGLAALGVSSINRPSPPGAEPPSSRGFDGMNA